MKLINLTPHEVTFYGADGSVICSVAPEATPARCSEISEQVGEVNSIPVVRKRFGEISNLPEPAEDTVYLVSLIVANAGKAIGRDDLRVTADPVRDSSGRIVGCRSLAEV